MDTIINLCVICSGAVARKHGPECRRCYKTNKQRAYRHEQPPEDKIVMLSLSHNMYEVDRQSYRDWMNGEY